MSLLPQQICSIDITYRNINLTEWYPLFIGILLVELEGESYKIKSYKFFPIFIKPFEEIAKSTESKELCQLSSQEFLSFLTNFNGLIIGHNILDEYKSINKSWEKLNINLKIDYIIANKTIDIYQFAKTLHHHSPTKYFKPNALENLSKRNLKRYKKRIQNQEKAWDSGNTLEVILHNKVDCELAYELWWYFLNNNILKIKPNPWPKKHPRYTIEDINKYLLKSPYLKQ